MSASLDFMETSAGMIAVRDTARPLPPIVFIHGIGTDSGVFAAQFNSPLHTSYRLIAIDLPGHGASADSAYPEHDYTITALADLIFEILDRLEIDRTLLFGWSIGGHIAIEAVSRHPERVSGLMITGTAPIGRGPIAALRGFHAHWDILLASRLIYSRRDAERFARLCYNEGTTEADVAAALRTDGRMRVRCNRSLMRGECADQRGIVETSTVPLAVVNGSDEPVVRLRYLAGLAYRNLWENTCHIVPDAGHAPFRTMPHAFNSILHRFATDVAIRDQRQDRGRSIRSA